MIFSIVCIFFFVIPGLALLYFLLSLILFLRARRREKLQPGSVPEDQKQFRKDMLSISSTLLATCVLINGGLFLLLCLAVANM